MRRRDGCGGLVAGMEEEKGKGEGRRDGLGKGADGEKRRALGREGMGMDGGRTWRKGIGKLRRD